VSELRPLPLKPSLREKVWGAHRLSPFYEDRAADRPAVGESWLTNEETVVASGDHAGATIATLMERYGPALLGDAHRPKRATYFPLLTKFLFIEDKLSVQVHPDDRYAAEHEGGFGKTEMWYVVDARPGAAVAVGLTETFERERLIEAAESGEIERSLRWVEVAAGDVVTVPAGLLHTMGPGMRICEIQQNSDLTYRFFDFGRPRELHVRKAADVIVQEPWPGLTPREGLTGEGTKRELLGATEYFRAEKLSWREPIRYRTDRERFHVVIFLEGRGTFDGTEYGPGSTFLVPAHAAPFEATPTTPTEAIIAYEG